MGEIIECVPNFSEGRNPEVIEAISAAIRSVPDVTLLDVDPGASTNRTVYTFVGNSSSVIQGALAAAKTARRLIDMTGHKGEHPRLGAMDVCPLIPVRGVTVEKCVAIARQLAELLAEELEVPIYLYGAASTREYRKTVAQIRAGEYEGLKDKLKEEKWAPDFGPACFDARWGATMVGVRKFLIAYNINLISTKEQAHRIALNIREAGRGENSPGRLKAVQGIGWWLEEANMAQVSLNLIDFDITPIHVAYEEVLKDAKELVLPVVGSEIVGLVPLKSILQVAEYYIEKEKLFVLEEDQKVRLAINRLGLSSMKSFVPEERIIEYRLKSEGASGRPLISLSVANFLKAIGARSSTPGGGSAAALVGAIGAALGAMVGQMTYGKRQFEHLETTMRPLITSLHCGFNKLLTVVDEDSAAFEEYKVARKLPNNTEEEKCKRDEALQRGLKSAIDVPLNLAIEVNKLWPEMVEMAKYGNMVTTSDMQVGARCLEASVWGAYYNVCINLQGLTNAVLKEEIQAKAEELVKIAQNECQSVLAALTLRQSNKK